MINRNVVLGAVLGLSILHGSVHADQLRGMPHVLESMATIDSVDSNRDVLMLDGKRYRLSPTATVRGIKDGRFRLKAGQRIAFSIDTNSPGDPPIIEEIVVLEK